MSDRTTFENSEIGSGLFRIYQSMSQGTYEYGGVFWNAAIKQFVPSGILGAEFKQSLLLPTIEHADTTFAAFLFYVSPMGFAQAYQQFWLFGGLIYVVLGWFVARIEQRRFIGPRQEILLVLMIPEVLATVSADLSLVVSRLLTYYVLIVLCVPRRAGFRPSTTDYEGTLPYDSVGTRRTWRKK
jgi:hypothetical protein